MANFCHKNKEIISFTLTLKNMFSPEISLIFGRKKIDNKVLTLIKTQECQSEGVWKAEKQCFKIMMMIIINFPHPNSIHGGGLSKSLCHQRRTQL
jgi:hypothetical protein